jgi:hypothetical protein
MLRKPLRKYVLITSNTQFRAAFCSYMRNLIAQEFLSRGAVSGIMPFILSIVIEELHTYPFNIDVKNVKCLKINF